MNETKPYSLVVMLEKAFGVFYILLALAYIPLVGTLLQVMVMFVLSNLNLVSRHSTSLSPSNIYIVVLTLLVLLTALYISKTKRNASNFRFPGLAVRITFYIFIIVLYGYFVIKI